MDESYLRNDFIVNNLYKKITSKVLAGHSAVETELTNTLSLKYKQDLQTGLMLTCTTFYFSKLSFVSNSIIS